MDRGGNFIFFNQNTPLKSLKKCSRNPSLTFTIPAPQHKVSPIENDENEDTVLTIQPFQKSTYVNFQKVYLNETKVIYLTISNPTMYPQILKVSKCPHEDTGFRLISLEVNLEPKGKCEFAIIWTPKKALKVREKIQFVNSYYEKFEAVLLGEAVVRKVVRKRARPIWNENKVLKDLKNQTCSTTEYDDDFKQRRKFRKDYSASETFLMSTPTFNDCNLFDTKELKYSMKQTDFKKHQDNKKSEIMSKKIIKESKGDEEMSWDSLNTLNDSQISATKCDTNKLEDKSEKNDKTFNEEINEDDRREKAAILIQSLVRGFLARQQFKKICCRKNAAVTIQKFWRGYLVRKKYHILKYSFEQYDYFNNKLSKSSTPNTLKDCEKNEIYREKESYSFSKVIEDENEKGDQDKTNKSVFLFNECEIEGKKLETVKYDKVDLKERGVILIQALVRGFLARRKMKIFNLRKEAAITIQKFVRGYLVRKKFNSWVERSESTLEYCDCLDFEFSKSEQEEIDDYQSDFVKNTERDISLEDDTANEYYASSILSDAQIEKNDKTVNEEINEDDRREKAAILIQSLVRGFLARRQFKNICLINERNDKTVDEEINEDDRREKAAILIQSLVRGFLARRQFKNICLINERKDKTVDEEINEDDRREKAAILIQSLVRGFLARRQFKNICLRNDAAITIQRFWRHSFVRKNILSSSTFIEKNNYIDKEYDYFNEKFSNSSMLNEIIDAYEENPLSSKIKTISFKGMIKKTIVNDNSCKLPISFNKENQLSVIVKSEEELKHNAAILIQALIRGFLARCRYKTSTKAIITIQKFWRRYSKRKLHSLNPLFIKEDNNTFEHSDYFDSELYNSKKNMLQNFTLETVNEYVEENISQEFIKNDKNESDFSWDSLYPMNGSSLQERKLSETFIDEKLENAVISIQSWIRGCLARRQYKFIHLQKEAAITIQKFWRGYLVRGKLKPLALRNEMNNNLLEYCNFNTVNINPEKLKETSNYFLEENLQKNVDEAVSTDIKQHLEKHLISRLEESAIKQAKENELKERGVILIQALVRGFLARRKMKIFNLRKEAAITIQKFVRGYLVRKKFNSLVERSESTLEYCDCLDFEFSKSEQEEIDDYQSDFVKNTERDISLEDDTANEYYASSILSDAQIEKNDKTVNEEINEDDRREKAAILIQSLVRGFLTRLRLFNKSSAAILIQAVFRGYLTRKKILSDPSFSSLKLYTFAKQEETCSVVAPTIGQQTSYAFNRLINYKQFCALHNELASLDNTTRISPQCCITICTKESLTVLKKIIRNSNRSEPNKLIIVSSVNILCNLAKYENTCKLLYTDDELIELCIQSCKKYLKSKNILSKFFTLIYLLVVKDQKKITTNISHLENFSRLLKLLKIICHKGCTKYDLSPVFYPYWSTAKSVQYEFLDTHHAIHCLANKFSLTLVQYKS